MSDELADLFDAIDTIQKLHAKHFQAFGCTEEMCFDGRFANREKPIDTICRLFQRIEFHLNNSMQKVMFEHRPKHDTRNHDIR